MYVRVFARTSDWIREFIRIGLPEEEEERERWSNDENKHRARVRDGLTGAAATDGRPAQRYTFPAIWSLH